jgi:hypothetical protein
LLNEAIRPATAMIGGLTVGPGVSYIPISAAQGYQYNLALANATFNTIYNGTAYLKDVGFTILICYNSDSPTRVAMASLLADPVKGIPSLNSRYKVLTFAIPWGQYLYAAEYGEMPLWILGWLADYPDAHDFSYPFYQSTGTFSGSQMYANATIDDLVNTAGASTNATERQILYNRLERGVIADDPSVMVDQPVGRHFQRDWMCGWYYNQILPGGYFYPQWKAYYTPQKLSSTSTYPLSSFLSFDITYNGIVDMTDIGFAALAYGSSYGPPIKTNWDFRCDVDNNRQIDMSDIGYMALYYGK